MLGSIVLPINKSLGGQDKMKIRTKILSLVSICILFTSVANKKADSGFLTTLGCIGAFATVINGAQFLGSFFSQDDSTFRSSARDIVYWTTFTAGMFGLNYFIDKYVENKT